MRLDIEFSDGHVRAAAEGSSAAAEKPQSPATSKPRRRRGNGDSNQGSLFGA
jgi:hypothetical protein